jgi:hypothetical protein
MVVEDVSRPPFGMAQPKLDRRPTGLVVEPHEPPANVQPFVGKIRKRPGVMLSVRNVVLRVRAGGG